MSLERVFRVLLVSEIVLTLAAIPGALVSERFLPPALQAFLQEQSDAPLTGVDALTLVLAVALIVVLVVAWVGLFNWWKSGPLLYLLACASAAPFCLMAGPTVSTAFETAFETISSMLSGVILGLVYFSDLRARFGAG